MSGKKTKTEHAKQQPPIRLSGLRYKNPVGKRIQRRADGNIEKVPLLSERAGAALAINRTFKNAAEAFDFRAASSAREMHFAGTFAGEVIDGKTIVVPQATRNRIDSDDPWSVLSSTGDYLGFREGAGLLRVDIDRPRSDAIALWPAEPPPIKTAADAVVALLKVLPEAQGAPTQAAPSSGSMIADAATGELLLGPGGWRVLVAVDDAREIPRLLKTIHRRCWSRGLFCFSFVNQGGGVLDRSLADQALARPTQPDYVVADLAAGLKRAEGATAVFNQHGSYLIAAAVTLTAEDDAAATVAITAAKAHLRPASVRQIKVRIATHTEVLIKRGVPRAVASKAAAKRFESGVLLGSDVIEFADGTAVAVSLLLSPEGEKYDGRLCRDPVEPDYDGRRVVGKFFWNGGKRPGIHSFAHGTKFWKCRHDAETAAKAIDAANGDNEQVVAALGLSDVEPLDFVALENRAARALKLGNKRKELKASVEKFRRQARDQDKAGGTHDAGASEANAEPWPIDRPLPKASFPKTVPTENDIRIVDHPDNIEFMIDRYGIGYRYDAIRKDIDWSHPSITARSDNSAEAFFSHMIGLCALNGVPSKNLTSHLTGLADARTFNPVVDYLSALRWDGKQRVEALATAIHPADMAVARVVLRLFLIEACAAADGAEIARRARSDVLPSFEGCLVPVGFQGVGKTKGLRRLLPPKLRRYFKEGVTLELKDKDSVAAAVSCWICELGELDATFRKSDIATMKAFLSKDVDELRRPYARTFSKYARRTAFSGSVNDEQFLADETGNRRFWPLQVGQSKLDWSTDELDQLWAEAWSLYVKGEQWWPSEREEELLAENAESFRIKGPIEDHLERAFKWGQAPADWGKRSTATDVFETLRHRAGVGVMSMALTKTIGITLARLWRRSGLVSMRDGVPRIVGPSGVSVLVNQPGGSSRGWLLPPGKWADEAEGFEGVDPSKPDVANGKPDFWN